jgi:hypothetical protein
LVHHFTKNHSKDSSQQSFLKAAEPSKNKNRSATTFCGKLTRFFLVICFE